jgi:hypothetical protein
MGDRRPSWGKPSVTTRPLKSTIERGDRLDRIVVTILGNHHERRCTSPPPAVVLEQDRAPHFRPRRELRKAFRDQFGRNHDPARRRARRVVQRSFSIIRFSAVRSATASSSVNSSCIPAHFAPPGAKSLCSIVFPRGEDKREHQKRRDQEEVGKGHHRGALSRTHLVAREGARDPPNDRAYRQEDGGYESNRVQQHSMLAANWPSRTFTLSNTSVDPSEDLLHRGVWILSNSPPERRDHLLLRGPWSGRIARACIRHGVPATVVGAMH